MSMADELRAIVREELERALLKHRSVQGTPFSESSYLTDAEAAVLANVHPSTIRSWRTQGLLNRYGRGKSVRVKREELERLMAPAEEREPTDADLDERVERVLRGGH